MSKPFDDLLQPVVYGTDHVYVCLSPGGNITSKVFALFYEKSIRSIENLF